MIATLSLIAQLAYASPNLPSIDSPNRTGQSAPNEAAVIVGLEDYAFIPVVPHAKRDAEAFRSFAQYTRGIAPDKIYFMLSASADDIEAAVDKASKSVGDGTVWIYFAGHGAASTSSGQRILLGDDVRPDAASFESRAVAVDLLERLGSQNNNRVLMVLDTCYAGTGRAGEDLVKGKRFAVPDYARPVNANIAQWTAAGPNQLSGPFDAAEHGLFTYFAVGALRGWADGELDGKRDQRVTAAEAQAYVQRMLGSLQQRSQTPAWNGASQDWVLATGVKEKGPDLATIQAAIEAAGTADAAQPVVNRDWQRRAENVNVNIHVDRSGMSEIRYLNALREERVKIEKRIRKDAERDWKETWKFASSGYTPEVARMLEVYIDKYAEAAVTVEERKEAVILAQTELAVDWHERMDAGWTAWTSKEVKRYKAASSKVVTSKPTSSSGKVSRKRKKMRLNVGEGVYASVNVSASPFFTFDGDQRQEFATAEDLTKTSGWDLGAYVPFIVGVGKDLGVGVAGALDYTPRRGTNSDFIGWGDVLIGALESDAFGGLYAGYHPAGPGGTWGWRAGLRMDTINDGVIIGFGLEYAQIKNVFTAREGENWSGNRQQLSGNSSALTLRINFGVGGNSR